MGLFFVGLVLIVLFSSGALGVLATRTSAPPRLTTGNVESAERAEVTSRFQQIMETREEALSRLDSSLLHGVYTPDSPQLRKDSGEIQKMRHKRERWVGLKLPVSILQATADSSRRWTVVALLGRSDTRLETTSGRLITKVDSNQQVYWCEMVKDPGRGWLLYRMIPPENLQSPS